MKQRRIYKGPHKTRVITNESEVPDGFVPSDSFGDRLDRRRISDLQLQGLVPAVKLMRTPTDQAGPLWVCRESVEGLLAAHGDEATTAASRTSPSACAEIVATLERIAIACERTAEMMERAWGGQP